MLDLDPRHRHMETNILVEEGKLKELKTSTKFMLRPSDKEIKIIYRQKHMVWVLKVQPH